MTRISDLQTKRNQESREAWGSFATHRARLTTLLRSLATGNAGTLCVLGAGNCNDLELKKLLASYETIQLVDLDGPALTAAVQRQSAQAERVRTEGDFDVTGVGQLLSAWSPENPANGAAVDHCLEALQQTPRLAGGPFTVAASVCLLSQLIEGVMLTLGERHPRFLELLTAVRRQHLNLLVELASPGGVIVLVTDIVSSASCPQLLEAKEADLPHVVSTAINARNFFTGVNPVVLRSLFSSDPGLASVTRSTSITPPWLWDLGPRQYAVCAIVVQLA